MILFDESATESVDGSRDPLAECHEPGVRFTKSRAVIRIGHAHSSACCLRVNAQALVWFAVLTQEAGMVPIVEPEVLMDGAQTVGQTGSTAPEGSGRTSVALLMFG